MPLVSFSHYREKCFFACPTLPNYASIFFINIEGRQKKTAILDNVKKKRVHMLLYVLLKIVDPPISSAFPNFTLLESNVAFHS